MKYSSIYQATGLLLLLLMEDIAALSLGSASKPYIKQKVCVFGAGGYLGGTYLRALNRSLLKQRSGCSHLPAALEANDGGMQAVGV